MFVVRVPLVIDDGVPRRRVAQGRVESSMHVLGLDVNDRQDAVSSGNRRLLGVREGPGRGYLHA